MNVLIAPNSMKGSLNAFEFANVVEKAFLNCSSEFNIRKVPVADGGDFTGEILRRKFLARKINIKVRGPLGEIVNSKYFIKNQVAVVEMADASGIKQVINQTLNPMVASSYGTGQLIRDAVQKGCKTIYLAVGGSATVDGGTGLMEALGFSFLNKNTETLPGNGKNLEAMVDIAPPQHIIPVSIKIITDVTNPLLGKNGAAHVFGPQKGADPQMVIQLEKGLENLASLVRKITGKDLTDVEGMGAAGGVAILLTTFLHAQIVPGAPFILELLDFEEHLKWADLVITGEGKIDAQTLNNKAPFAVLQASKKHRKPVIAIAGKVENEGALPFDAAFSFINEPLNLETSMGNASQILYNFSVQLAKLIYSLKG